MRLIAVGFILFQIAVQSDADKYGTHYPPRPRSHEEDILEPPEPDYRSSQQRDYHSYEDEPPRKDYDLPVTLKAPPYEQPPYGHPPGPHRRTFFQEDFSPEKQFQGLYRFMSSIFNGGRDETPPEYHHNRGAPPYVTPVTKHVTPYRYAPTEPNYIPPPKPIRASVIKLETVTRSPIYSSFEYETTARYYPPVKEILDQVLIENSRRARQNSSWYDGIPPFKPLPVLPKPEYVPATTLKPHRGGLYEEQTRPSFEYYNKTDFKYPDSVQDQLPDFDVGEVRIPYEAEGPQVFHSPPTEIATTNFDIRSLNPPTNRRERPPLGFEYLTTTVKSFPGAVEKVKRPVFKYTKKLTAQLDKGPVERVTNLTVLGYSKPGVTEVPTRTSPIDYIKVRDLISYEMGKLSGKTADNSTTRPVNLNDELSLDARILKDTNWDGLTVPETSTTEIPRETTTIFQDRIVFTDAKSAKTAFWEIGQNTAPGSDLAATTTTPPITTTDQGRYQTTTEFFWPSTTTTEDATVIPVIPVIRLGNLKEETSKSEDVEIVEVTPPPTPKRRYSRRPKIVNFTPYPTGEELQRRVATRNHFPRRQKPNITLSFGKKDIIKPRQVFVKDEVMKFSDEDVRKRRKIEKRRRVLKRIRVTSSSERSVPDESL